MIDNLPAHRTLPDDVRLRARRTLDEGLSPRPSRRTPVYIAAGVSLLAAGAVVAGQFLGGGPDQVAGPTTLEPTQPWNGQFDPDQRDRFHYTHRVVDPDTTARCVAAGKDLPPVAEWTPLGSATKAGSTLAAFRVPGAWIFCAATSTTVSVSAPMPDRRRDEMVKVLFNGPNGELAGLSSHPAKGFSIQAADGRGGAVAMSTEGLFFAPRGFLGAEKGATYTWSGQNLPITDVPAPSAAVLDRPKPPGDRTSEAGRKLGECLRDRPFADAAQFAPGVDTRLNETATVLLGRFGDRLAVCSNDTTNPTEPFVRDRDELTWFRGESVAGTHVFYNFRKGAQGELSSNEPALAGLVSDSRAASITYVRPGHQDKPAVITGGTFVLTGIPLETPADSKIVVRDADGKVIEEIAPTPNG